MNDRERLIDILYEAFYISPENDIKGTAQKAAVYLISHGVTVQKHGRWKKYFHGKMLMCSSCRATFWDENENGGSTYCPCCGARMDLEDSNG